MSTLADRIREAMGQMSQADLARAANVSDGAVTQWLDGTTKSLRSQTAALLEQATGYRASWIVTGKGPRKVAQADAADLIASAASTMEPILAWQYEDELPPGEFVMVPRLEMKLSAGHGDGASQIEIMFNEHQPQAFRADWIRQHRLKPNKLAAMVASGDSMEPTLHDRDSLLIDTSQIEVQDGKVYALWYEGGERVKRLYRLPGGGLRIESENPRYRAIELGPEYAGHVRIIGRVVHRSGTGGL